MIRPETIGTREGLPGRKGPPGPDGAPSWWLRDAPLGPLSNYRSGGVARWLVVPRTEEEFAEAIAFARAGGWPWIVLGGGTNTLISDGSFDGVVLSTEAWIHRTVHEDGRIVARAGTSLRTLIGAALANGFAGLEGFIGIPGTIGGAVWGNAGGATGGIAPWVESITLLEEDGTRAIVAGDTLPWAYRESGLGARTILEVTLRLQPGAPPAELRAHAMEVYERKQATQPLHARSAGCVFRNPDGDSAGRLIETAGLKGARIGDAIVSEQHANFIVNSGAASSTDIERLIERVRDAVRRIHHVRLQREIIVAGTAGAGVARSIEHLRSEHLPSGGEGTR